MPESMAEEQGDEQKPPVAFFCHVMKTGGTSLRLMLLESHVVRPDEMAPYIPNGTFQQLLPFYVINPFIMRDKMPKTMGSIKIIYGHYPFLSYRLYPPPLVTISLFRDPVDRAVSHLMHLQRHEHRNRSYEEIYDDKKVFDAYLYNLQARAFVFEDENARSLMERTFDWNEEWLERAKQNVELLDIIGLTSEFTAFIHALEKTFDWRFNKNAHYHRAPRTQAPVPNALRERMREDLDYDIRFYEHVIKLYRERQAAAAANP